MDREDVGSFEQLVLGHQDCAGAVAASGVMFWLQAIGFIPKALPIPRHL